MSNLKFLLIFGYTWIVTSLKSFSANSFPFIKGWIIASKSSNTITFLLGGVWGSNFVLHIFKDWNIFSSSASTVDKIISKSDGFNPFVKLLSSDNKPFKKYSNKKPWLFLGG